MGYKESMHIVSTLVLGLGLSINAYPQSSPTNGLIAYYPFNGNALDASGNRNDGSVLGGSFVTNRFGLTNSALSVTSLTHGTSTPLLENNITKYTITGWFRTTLGGILVGNDGTGPHLVLSIHTTPSGGPRKFFSVNSLSI